MRLILETWRYMEINIIHILEKEMQCFCHGLWVQLCLGFIVMKM